MTRDELVERAQRVLEADERVKAAWLSGSLGRGVADAYSDVDLLVALEKDDFASFAGDAPALLDSIAKTVFWQQVPGIPVWNAVSGSACRAHTRVQPVW